MARSALAALALLLSGCGDSRCALKPQPGPCEALIDGYYFNAAAGQCAAFEWGGCGGVRPFSSLSECQQACE